MFHFKRKKIRSKKSLAINSIYNIIYTVSNMIFPLLTYGYAARILFSDGVGKVAYAQNVASYFVTLAASGLPSHGIREIAKVRNSKENTNKVFSELLLINTVTTTVSLVFYTLFVAYLFNDRLLYIICALPIIFNYINVDWFYQGQEEYPYIVKRSIAVKFFSLCILFVLVHEKSDYYYYALISGLAIAGNNIFNIIHIRHFVQLTKKGLTFEYHIRHLVILAISIFFSTIYSKIDTLMIGLQAGESYVGYYTYAQKLIQMCVTISVSVSAAFLPRLSFYYNNDKRKFYELVEFGTKILCFIAFPIAIGILVLAPQIVILLFGDEFICSASTVRILILVMLIQSFGNLLCYQLVLCTGNEKKRLPAYICASICNVLLNYILIKKWQHNGAAIASVVAEFMVNGIQYYQMKKILNPRLDKKFAFMEAINSIAMGIVVLFISRLFNNNLLCCLITIPLGALVYFTLNIMEHNELIIVIFEGVKEKIK